MSGLKRSPFAPDREVIAEALLALASIDAATRTRSGLAARAGKSRVTLLKVLDAEFVRDDTLMAFDDAVQVPPGTLKRIGEGTVAYTELGLTAAQVEALQRLDNPSGPARNQGAV
jgi:hypothetical protein